MLESISQRESTSRDRKFCIFFKVNDIGMHIRQQRREIEGELNREARSTTLGSKTTKKFIIELSQTGPKPKLS